MTSEYLTYDTFGEPVGVQNEYSTVVRDWGIDDPNGGREGIDNPVVPSGINPMPIANAMLVTQIGNQFFLGPNTHTDWVIAEPMRKHAIYNNYQYTLGTDGYVPGELVIDPEDGTTVCVGDVPVNGTCGDETADAGAYWNYLEKAFDVNARFDYWNREEAQTTVEPGDFSPPLVTPETSIPFEREVNILTLNLASDANPESVLGSQAAQGIKVVDGFENGWGAFTFNTYDLNGPRYDEWVDHKFNQRSALGVPVHGFMAVRSLINAGGGQVGETFPHFSTRDRIYNGEVQ